MKTTVDISDALLTEARRTARRKGTTLKALIEQGLRTVLDDETDRPAFTLRDASVTGDGLQREVRGAGWDEIRDLAYGSRGGDDRAGDDRAGDGHAGRGDRP